MSQPLNARVSQLETMGRVEHFDSEGGGRIQRVIYCEPYTAHKRVVTALKGTVYPQGNGRWERAMPHADPLYPWFYCTDVQVEPAFPSAVRGSLSKGFNPLADDLAYGEALSQFLPIQTALNVVDDFDGAAELDNLTLAQIQDGGKIQDVDAKMQILNTDEQIPQAPYASEGRCGAKITATYSPLLFLQGLGTLINTGPLKFDYVDPQWEPLTLTTATGRTLCMYAPSGSGIGAPFAHWGLEDTFALPEVVWRFSIRRLMVPFIPAYTIAMFANKLNRVDMVLGSLMFPSRTVRMETPEIITRRAPDGQMMHDILLKFLVRRLYDEAFSPVGSPDDRAKGWITWNHAFGIPRISPVDLAAGGINPPSYYPVVWNGGLFQTFGVNHPLFLDDWNANIALIPDTTGLTSPGRLDKDPFEAGMRDGQ
jgi:hypothetical protein